MRSREASYTTVVFWGDDLAMAKQRGRRLKATPSRGDINKLQSGPVNERWAVYGRYCCRQDCLGFMASYLSMGWGSKGSDEV